ncbi:MAG: OmpH family outer membrane protein [Bacteroidetes bacterium]|nr:OmpH family outer membrane protein [Bacteroidota bacterium]
MKNSLLSLLTAVLFVGSLNGAQAQTQVIKIGYADPEIIITYMPEYQTVQQQMAVEYRTSQEALQALAEDFQERVDRYQRQQPLLSEERRAEREAELATLQQEIQSSAAAKDDELASRQEELMAPLLQKVQDAIDAIAQAKGLDMVIRSPALLYVNPDRVININIDIARRLGIEVDEDQVSDVN